MTRILVYSHDTFGLGNIRRMLRISEALVERDPHASVLLITGSPMLHAFRLPSRIDYVKLPCLARDVDGVYGVKHLEMEFDDAVRMRTSLILSAASDFVPDMLLIDKKPLGVAGELKATLEMLSMRSNPPAIHLLLRDILDAPGVTREIWEAHDYHDAITRFYQSVIVVGDAEVFDLANEYRFPPATKAKLHYAGYINHARSDITPSSCLTTGKRPCVLIHAGGGEDGSALLDSAFEALLIGGSSRGFSCRVVGGPELAPIEQARLGTLFRSLPDVTWLEFSDAMGTEIAAADLVISMGGYNSICEVLSYRKRAIIVPRSTPVLEQRMRAEALAKRGLLSMIAMEDLTPMILLRQIRTELGRINVIPGLAARIRFTGLEEVCNCMLGSGIESSISARRLVAQQ